MKSSVQKFLLGFVVLVVIVVVLPKQGISAFSFGEIIVFSAIGVFVVMILTLLLNPSNGFSVYAGIFFIFTAIGLLEEKSPLNFSSESKSEVA